MWFRSWWHTNMWFRGWNYMRSCDSDFVVGVMDYNIQVYEYVIMWLKFCGHGKCKLCDHVTLFHGHVMRSIMWLHGGDDKLMRVGSGFKSHSKTVTAILRSSVNSYYFILLLIHQRAYYILLILEIGLRVSRIFGVFNVFLIESCSHRLSKDWGINCWCREEEDRQHSSSCSPS